MISCISNLDKAQPPVDPIKPPEQAVNSSFAFDNLAYGSNVNLKP